MLNLFAQIIFKGEKSPGMIMFNIAMCRDTRDVICSKPGLMLR